jgi:hypothetical protein
MWSIALIAENPSLPAGRTDMGSESLMVIKLNTRIQSKGRYLGMTSDDEYEKDMNYIRMGEVATDNDYTIVLSVRDIVIGQI